MSLVGLIHHNTFCPTQKEPELWMEILMSLGVINSRRKWYNCDRQRLNLYYRMSTILGLSKLVTSASWLSYVYFVY